MGSNITLVCTSCDRHDLLKQTLDSFIAMSDAKPDACIIVEDSAVPMPDWLRNEIHYYASRLGKIQWVQNECRMGQLYSIDRAYALVQTDYIFHCEDDWLFCERGGWMAESKAILEKHPNIIMVSLRGQSWGHQLVDLPKLEGFKVAMPYWKGCWGGIAFNPGLRRLSDYKRLGSYGKILGYELGGLIHERKLSMMYLDQGFRIADLNRDIVTHIGGSRSRANEPLAPLPRVLIAVPACHKFEYGQWESEKSPHYKGGGYNGAAYGTDIHISGPNPRIQAIRDTWAKDIEPFKAHVDLRFFYGVPHDRPALDDEIYLGCPDDYEHLPLKSVELFRWALNNGYDYVLKVDDDTAVYVDRVIHELMTTRFDYAGYCHSNVCSGGPGYWLSKRAMKIVNERGGNPDHWAEDVWIAKTMSHANIYPINLAGHRPGFSQHWFFGDKFDATKLKGELVTLHAVQPEVLRDWYAHERKQ